MGAVNNSFVFLATPTSGTGSLWRLISIFSEAKYKLLKISEQYALQDKLEDLPSWRPESAGHGYMYNTPHINCEALEDPSIRLIVNFRDPRDMACNQYHWVFQHPDHTKTPEQLETRRKEVMDLGIDQYVRAVDNRIHFNAFRKIEGRLKSDSENVLILSYNQLCLGFDDLVERLRKFFGVPSDQVPWNRVEVERVDNLKSNPSWIGQIWQGADVQPGRYLQELTGETVKILDDKYGDVLRFIRRFELHDFRHFLTTTLDREEEKRVLYGRDGILFLQADSSDVIGQILGRRPISDDLMIGIAGAHRDRRVLCQHVLGAVYDHIVVPNKEVVLAEWLPDSVVFESLGPRPIRQYFESMAGKFWTPFYNSDILKSEFPTENYAKTDSHWTHAGALSYLKEFFRVRYPDIFELLESLSLRHFPSRQLGDLGLKIYLDPDDIEIVAPEKSDARQVFWNEVSNEGSVRHYVNLSAPSKKKLFVMHDSFSMWLMGFFPAIFEEVLFVHGVVFDIDLINDFGADIVLCIQVERFFLRLPENNKSAFDFIKTEEINKRAKLSFSKYFESISKNESH